MVFARFAVERKLRKKGRNFKFKDVGSGEWRKVIKVWRRLADTQLEVVDAGDDRRENKLVYCAYIIVG